MATTSLEETAHARFTGGLHLSRPGRHSNPPASARHTRPARPGATILLVEDDAQVRDLTRLILKDCGYTVLTAESDSQALWVWERHRSEIQLVIADMMIPNCATGLDLARKLQAQKPDLRVLFTSGFGKEIGGDDTDFLRKAPFLQKPYTASSLLQSITSCFETEIQI